MSSTPPTPQGHRQTDAIDERVEARACEILLRNGTVSVLAGYAIAILLAVGIRGVVAESTLLSWLLLLGVLSLVRLMLTRRWAKGLLGAVGPAEFLHRFRVLTLMAGVVWGASPVMLNAGTDLEHQLILTFSLAGVCAGAMTTLAIDSWSVRLFLLPCMVPISLGLLAHTDSVTRVMGMMCLLFVSFMALNSSRVGRDIRTNLRLELEAEQRERVLRESEYRLKAAQKVAQIGSFDWDLDSGEVRWSDEHFALWGFDPARDKPSIQAFSSRVPADDLVVVRGLIADAIRMGRGYDCVHRVCWPDGTTLQVHERAEVVKDAEGRVVRVIGTVQDVTESRAAEARIRALAYFDPATQLPNRNLLQERLSVVVETNALTHSRGALLLIDLDHFKNLNDAYGYEQGDTMLRLVAERLQACVRRSDTVARLGGDEFMVMLDNLPEDPIQAAERADYFAAKILRALSAPFALAGREQHITASIGVTIFRQAQAGTDELFKRAELAMYQAKNAGRNTLRFFTTEMEARARDRMILEADLRAAVRDGGLRLHYQGQVDAAGRWIGAEALLRWPHPTRRFVPPDEMIPIAEESGLILPIGHWVLEQACAQLVEWSRTPGMEHLTLSINVSAQQFRQPHFVTEVMDVVRSSGVNPGLLKLELTESLLLHDVEGVIATMSALQQQGISFALDDFGIGYSSLSYLKRLPLSQLKIDKAFVRDVLDDPNDAAIVSMILALGKSLGLAVVAEGVETEGQRTFLAESGCVGYQGYLFCRPIPAEEFRERVRTRPTVLESAPMVEDRKVITV